VKILFFHKFQIKTRGFRKSPQNYYFKALQYNDHYSLKIIVKRE